MKKRKDCLVAVVEPGTTMKLNPRAVEPQKLSFREGDSPFDIASAAWHFTQHVPGEEPKDRAAGIQVGGRTVAEINRVGSRDADITALTAFLGGA